MGISHERKISWVLLNIWVDKQLYNRVLKCTSTFKEKNFCGMGERQGGTCFPPWVWGQSSWHNKFQASQGNTMKPCHKNIWGLVHQLTLAHFAENSGLVPSTCMTAHNHMLLEKFILKCITFVYAVEHLLWCKYVWLLLMLHLFNSLKLWLFACLKQ